MMSLMLGPAAACQQTPFRNELMPQPAHLQVQGGDLPVSSSFTARVEGASSPLLEQALLRTLRRMEDKGGVPLARTLKTSGDATLEVHVRTPGPEVQTYDEDESYSLKSDAAGVHIEAATPLGALHAMETLVQLMQPGPKGYVVPAVSIEDAPRFHWRGLMIDCARHFEPLDVLKRNIDAMAAVKLNVFHWHLTDDQGFRIESKVYPKLTELGSDGLFYTQDQARELVAYARARGVRVVPEFEMPGHSTAWLMAYPEFNSGTQPAGIRREFGISDYVLDPTREEIYPFLERFLREMTTVFPDQYVHIGGDEAPAPDWKTNPRILAFKKAHDLKDNDALQAYFNQRVLAILTKLHRHMVGWDEIFNPALPKDVVIQSWRGEASLAKAAQQGYQGVLSAPYYLDAMKPASVHYLADPIPADTKLTAAQQKLILGGEVCMWAEQLDQRTIDSRIWPRTAAIAERFWSPQDVRDVDDMYRRLAHTSVELETLGTRQLTSQDAGLRALAGREQIEPLRVFASAFQPESFSDRYKQQRTSQLTPLTGFVDAVAPDPPVRHQVEMAVQTMLSGTADAASKQSADGVLRRYFQGLQGSVAPVQAMMAEAPRLRPMQTRAGQLSGLSATALEALEYVQSGKQASATWKSHAQKQIAEAKQPSAIVRFVFLPALEQMVAAVK